MRFVHFSAVAALLFFSSCLLLIHDDSGTALSGVWGGPHVAIDFRAATPTVEYDCARGSIDGAVTTDDAGKFAVTGVYIQEHGGPISEDEIPDAHPARYEGAVHGSKMTLTVTLTDTDTEIGTFSLEFGANGMVFKCV